MTKSTGSGRGGQNKGTSTWVNSRVSKQNKKMVKELNAASKSRGLIKARLMTLTAKVSVLESNMEELYEFFGFQITEANREVREKAVQRLVKASEVLAEEE